MFSVGQKVVCIADYSDFAAKWWAQALKIETPLKGEIYTIRRLVQRPDGGDIGYGLMLAEIENTPCLLDKRGEGGGVEIGDSRLMSERDEVAFASCDFRPLITVEDFVTTCAESPVAGPVLTPA